LIEIVNIDDFTLVQARFTTWSTFTSVSFSPKLIINVFIFNLNTFFRLEDSSDDGENVKQNLNDLNIQYRKEAHEEAWDGDLTSNKKEKNTDYNISDQVRLFTNRVISPPKWYHILTFSLKY
jgi:hypothetical protein